MSFREAFRSTWNRRAPTWHESVHNSDAFAEILEAVMAAARPVGEDHAVDLGAGSGFLTIPLASHVATVVAVDYAAEMMQILDSVATEAQVTNVTSVVANLASFDLPKDSVDLVVSNYALHHLTNADKAALMGRAYSWLKPGGRIVIADMMFGRGRTARDRAILKDKVRELVAKGPAGVWRIVKNVTRFGLGLGDDRPASPQFWLEAMEAAGFVEVEYRSVVAEAGLVVGRMPTGRSDGRASMERRR